LLSAVTTHTVVLAMMIRAGREEQEHEEEEEEEYVRMQYLPVLDHQSYRWLRQCS
jgi:hypothetical protein